MIPYSDGAPQRTPCEVLEYTFTKVWNQEAKRQAFSNMGCKPAGYAGGERVFKITADYVDRKGRHWKFDGIFDSSGYSTFTEMTRNG